MTRRVNVKLTGDASDFINTLAKAGAATEALDRKVEDAAKRAETAKHREQTAVEKVRIAQTRLNEVQRTAKKDSAALQSATYNLARAQREHTIRTNETAAAVRRLDRAEQDRAAHERTLGAAGSGGGRVPPGDFSSIEKEAGDAGHRSGRTFAHQFGIEFRQRSVFIAAVVGAALTAGAPIALAGAALLFGGIGALAGAQSLEVRKAWTALGNEIKDGAVEDAKILIPALTDSAADLGAAFEDLRPQLRAAFEATAPLVQSFSDGVIGLTENAMPGFVSAVRDAGPVMDGFQSFLEGIGSGLSEMFQEMADHSSAAGQAFAAWGDVFHELLPLIGELLGQGSELATIVLPPLADVLSLIHTVLGAIGPLLPPIVAGLAGFKIASLVGGGLGVLGGVLGGVAKSAEQASNVLGNNFAGQAAVRAERSAEKLGKSFKGMKDSLAQSAFTVPVFAAVLGGAAAIMDRANEQADQWTRAILEGGDAAELAKTQMSDFGEASAATNSGFGGFLANLVGAGTAIGQTGIALDDATDSINKQEAALSGLEIAQRTSRTAQDKLQFALDHYKEGSPEVVAAAAAYRRAQADVEYQSGKTEAAISGVTQAMLDQADAALAGIDSGFAFRHATDQLEDAQKNLADVTSHLNDANKETRTTAEDVARAQLDLEEQTYRTALAYGQQQADLSGLSSESSGYRRLVQEQMLVALHRLRDAAGPEMRVAIDKQIKALEDSGVAMDTTSAQAGNLRDTVKEIPQYTRIRVEADIGPAQKTLSDFIGRHWTAIISSQVQGSGTSGSGGTQFRIAAGGWVNGPGTPTSDSIPAMLSDGEFVVNARSASQHRALLEQINRPVGFADGGPVMKDKITVRYDVDLAGANAGILDARQAAGRAFAAAAPSAPGGNAAIVQQLAASLYGWVGSQWNSLYSLIMKESGFRNTAQNPTSTAYGMFQFLDSTWGSTGISKTSDPRLQTIAGLRYIASRYGSPSSALGFHLAHNYYANGGVVSEPVFGVGRSGQTYSFAERGPEVVLPTGREFGGGRGGSPTVNVTVTGARISGRLELGGDGFVHLIDGRIDQAFGGVADEVHYAGVA